MRNTFVAVPAILLGLLVTGCVSEQPPPSPPAQTSKESAPRDTTSAQSDESFNPLRKQIELANKMYEIRQSLGHACTIQQNEDVPVVDFDYLAHGESFVPEYITTVRGGFLIAVSNDAFQDFRAVNGLRNDAVEIYKLSSTSAKQLVNDTPWVKNAVQNLNFSDASYFVTSRKCAPKIQ